MKLDIIIPVYNEGHSIQKVIENVLQVNFGTFIDSFQIIIVDDCSTDATYENSLEIAEKQDNIKLLRHDVNKGKGAAVRFGIASSDGDIIVIQDADLELIPSDIPNLIQAMDQLDLEFINGSRYMHGIIRPLYSYNRYFFNTMFTKVASVLINVRLTDLACGYKLFTRNIYNQIHLKEDRFGFEAELLIKVVLLKKTLITEVPVHYFPRNYGEGKKITNLDGFKIFWTILKYGLLRVK